MNIKDNTLYYCYSNQSGKRYEDLRQIKDYINQIKVYPLLSIEDEKKLAKRKDNGDAKAKQMLINSNLRLVVSIALKSKFWDIPIMDIIQEGNIGLIKGIKRYDYKKGCRVSTYVTWWIKKSISDFNVSFHNKFNFPHYRYPQFYAIAKAEKILTSNLQRKPDVSEIATFLKLPEEQISNVSNNIKNVISLDVLLNEKVFSILLDIIQENCFADPAEIYEEKEHNKAIWDTLNTLSPKEMDVITKRFGLNYCKPMTLKEIACIYNMSVEGVRKIQNRAIKKLKEASSLLLY